jgi:hypothetical protein
MLKTVRVFSSPSDKHDIKSTPRLELFCRNAAPYVMQFFANGDLWGVTWGRHLDLLTNALNDPKLPRPKRDSRINFVPLCGEAYGVRPTSQSSSVIAERLTMLLNDTVPAPLSLSMVPAFIPSDLKDESERAAVWTLIGCSPSYVQIFGSERLPARVRARLCKRLESANRSGNDVPMAERLDGVLTALSQDNRPFGLGAEHMYSTAGLDGQLVDKLYLGDIGGVAIPKNAVKEQDALQTRWTGLTRQHLLDCATRAATNGAQQPGVVVICMGAGREKTLLECVRLGMINHLVIDTELADRVKQKLPRGRLSS